MNVQVLGTKFNFKSTQNCRIAETSLIEGEVKVTGNNNEGAITLSPGQKVELNTVTRQMKVSETNAALDAIWHNNLIPFKNADVFEIAEVLEKYMGSRLSSRPISVLRQLIRECCKKGFHRRCTEDIAEYYASAI